MNLKKSTHPASSERKRAIIEAALDLFTDKGFSETSMADICKSASASTGSVYHHFKSKEQLAAAVYLEGIEEYQKGMIKALDRQKEARAGISAIIAYHMTWAVKNSRWAQFLSQQRHAQFMSESDSAINDLNRSFATFIGGWFKEQIQKGEIRPIHWDLIIAILLGPCHELSRLYLTGKAVTSIKDSIKVLTESAWKSLSAHEIIN